MSFQVVYSYVLHGIAAMLSLKRQCYFRISDLYLLAGTATWQVMGLLLLALLAELQTTLRN